MFAKPILLLTSFGLAAPLGLIAAGPVARDVPRYSISDLGSLGGTAYDAAWGMNATGDATGYASVPNSGNVHAFFSKNGVMQDLGTLGGPSSFGNGVNNADIVVGASNVVGDAITHAFVWQNGIMRDVTPHAGYAAASAINNQNVIAGTIDGQPFTWSQGVIQILPSPPGLFNCGAAAINESGQVAGNCEGGFASLQGFFYNGQQTVTLGDLGGGQSEAYAVNNAGAVVGASVIRGVENVWRAFVWRNGTMINLGLPAHGVNSYGYGINNLGQIVGEGMLQQPDGTLVDHAFLFNHGQWIDLQVAVGPGTGWTLSLATAINDAGEIVGYGTHNGVAGAFLLTPQ